MPGFVLLSKHGSATSFKGSLDKHFMQNTAFKFPQCILHSCLGQRRRGEEEERRRGEEEELRVEVEVVDRSVKR